MNDFEIELSDKNKKQLIATDTRLYSYDFSSFSLLSLQEAASDNLTNRIKKEILSNTVKTNLANKLVREGDTEYVAKLSDIAKKKIKKGEWVLGIKKKTGETYGVLRDKKTGQNKSFIALDKKTIKDLGNLPELSSIQEQLSSISEGLEDLNQMIQRVEQGQYNDRFSGFFSTRQLVIEGLLTKDELIKKSLLLSAIQTNNETIAKLALSIHQDGLSLADPKTKNKDAKRIENLIQLSLEYLNLSVQLNLVAYTELHEEDSLFATLTNYYSYINQVFLKKYESGKSIAWLIDNGHSGENGEFVKLTKEVSNRIQSLIKFYNEPDRKGIENETSKKM